MLASGEATGHLFGDAFGGFAIDRADDGDDGIFGNVIAPVEALQVIDCDLRQRGIIAVGVMGVTGQRSQLAASAVEIAARCKQVTDKPTLVGVGVSNPEQAAEVVQVADGVVVGTSIVRRLLDGDGPEGVAELVAQYRQAVDGS